MVNRHYYGCDDVPVVVDAVVGTQKLFCNTKPVAHVPVAVLVPVVVDAVVGTQKLFCNTKPVAHVPVAVLVPVVEEGCCPCKSP